MLNRLPFLLLAASAFAFACGPRSRTEPPASTQRSTSDVNATLATALDVTVDSRVTFALHVTNNTDKRIELNFPSGQTHDFVVTNENGREVWRWSAEQMFTQALQNRMLGARETMSYSERWDPAGQRGTFTAVATLTSTNHPVRETVTFSLP